MRSISPPRSIPVRPPSSTITVIVVVILVVVIVAIRPAPAVITATGGLVLATGTAIRRVLRS